MKETRRFLVKGFCIIIAAMVTFLVCAADKADAASVLIPVAEFTTDGGTNTAPGDFYKLFSGGYLVGSASDPCFVAPVKIPGNATKINKVIVYLIDDGSGVSDPWFQLDAIDMAAGAVDNYTAGGVTTGTSTIQAIELPLSKKALVKGRVYQLGTCLDAGQYLYGAKVIYTVPY
jgi:phosphate/sulfate permease